MEDREPHFAVLTQAMLELGLPVTKVVSTRKET